MALASIVLWSPALAAEPARTVILVRHAERAGGMSPEVGISDAGRCRAQVLAGMLADAGLKHIYTTEISRTQETAAPLAKKLAMQFEVVPAKDVSGLVARLRTDASGGIDLVVGHSNTLPEVIQRLSGRSVPPIGRDEYDRMFIVTLTGADQATVVAFRYPGCAR